WRLTLRPARKYVGLVFSLARSPCQTISTKWGGTRSRVSFATVYGIVVRHDIFFSGLAGEPGQVICVVDCWTTATANCRWSAIMWLRLTAYLQFTKIHSIAF